MQEGVDFWGIACMWRLIGQRKSGGFLYEISIFEDETMEISEVPPATYVAFNRLQRCVARSVRYEEGCALYQKKSEA